MKIIIVCSILQVMNLIASMKTRRSEDQVSLRCPDGLLAKGLSWYGKFITDNPGENIFNSKYFSICVNCKPEKESPYQWIEICLTNNVNPLGGSFTWKTQSCEDKPNDAFNELLPVICQEGKPVCGLIVTNGMVTLNKSIEIAQPIPCTNGVANPRAVKENQDRSIGYDVELACPEKSTLLGLERFQLPASDGFIPVFSSLCKLNDNIKEHVIFIYAKGKLNDEGLLQLFAKSPNCPIPSQKGNGTRCELMESPSEFCSLRWDSTTIKLLNCSTGNKIKAHEDLCYEEVEVGQIVSGARIFERRNHKIPIHNSATIALQSNDKYLYTVPVREENFLNQAAKGTNYMNAEMFIK